MIARISAYFFLPMCILALFLALVGVEQISLGDSYYTFLKSVSISYSKWRFEIPSIPNVPLLKAENFSKTGGIINVLIAIGNFFVAIVNGLVGVVNFGVMVINIVITIIQFILTLIYQCKDFITRVSESVIAYV